MTVVKITLKADGRQIMAKLAALRAVVSTSTDAAAKVLAETVIAELYAAAPVDTGRLKNGFADMYKQANLGPAKGKVPIKPSKRAAEIIRRLEKQADRLGRKLGMAKTAAKGGKVSKVLENQYAKAKAERNKSRSSNSFVMVYNSGRAVKYTIRDRVYGGLARKRPAMGGSGVVYEFRHLEPHAIIWERTNRKVAMLLAVVKVAGARKVKQVMLPALKKATAAQRKWGLSDG